MQWLDTLTQVEASAGFVLAGMNFRQLMRYARTARTAGRRAGASVLALVSAAFGLEAVVFLAGPALELSTELRDASAFAVRSSLLAASAAVSLLLFRGRRSRV